MIHIGLHGRFSIVQVIALTIDRCHVCMGIMDSKLIERSGISLFDPQLRDSRDMRFKLFETACSLAARKGHRLDEGMALELFGLCQDMAFKTSGLPVSSSDQPENPELLSLIKDHLGNAPPWARQVVSSTSLSFKFLTTIMLRFS